jgi:hypothetical protein
MTCSELTKATTHPQTVPLHRSSFCTDNRNDRRAFRTRYTKLNAQSQGREAKASAYENTSVQFTDRKQVVNALVPSKGAFLSQWERGGMALIGVSPAHLCSRTKQREASAARISHRCRRAATREGTGSHKLVILANDPRHLREAYRTSRGQPER